jgi:UDP-N-acetylmuramyl pentapeptide phosphotransferase/UDP-N-acetylglucosamine-1-phosphate transferase
MNSILIIIFNIFLILFINSIFKKINFLVDKKELKHKSFVSKSLVPISGGFLIFINLLIFNSSHLVIFLSFLIFTLGIFSDLLIIKSPLKKFLIQLSIVITFIFFIQISIFSTKVFFIDFFIKNTLFSLFFTAFCLLIIINGSNFLDGVNTLVCGYYILVILAILYLGNYNLINYNFLEFYHIILPLLVILFFNLFSKTYLGDSGTFLLSFTIGHYLIHLSNINLTPERYMSPIFVLLLLWYPAFENLFSILRKIIIKKNPSRPDNFHLHHFLFMYINKIIKNKNASNNLTGITINLFNFFIFLIGIQFYNKNDYLFYLVMFCIIFYTVFYFFLKKILKK